MTSQGLTAAKGTGYGVAFGVVSGIIMGGIGYLFPVPMMAGNPPFFISAVEMWNIPSPTVVGWVLQLVTSALLGAIFGFLTTKFATFRLKDSGRALVLGAVAGVIIWFILFLPVEIPPMPMLFAMGSFDIESIAYNIVFGVVLAVLMWTASRSPTPKAGSVAGPTG